MDSATPLEPAPAAGGSSRGDVSVNCCARVRELANDGLGLAGGGTSLAGQACPVSQGGGDTYPLFPGENRESVAVAAPGNMVKSGMTQSVEVLLRSGPMWLFRLAEKSERRKVEKSGSRNSRNLAAAGGDRIPLFPGKEPVAVATPRTRVKCGITK